MLLVTGANGNLGGAVIANLRAMVKADALAVATRNPESEFAKSLAAAGIEVRRADFDDPATLPGAFRAIRKALIISTYADNAERLRQNLAAVEAARTAGVGHIVYTSFLGAGPDALAEHSQRVHYPTEQAIQASGMAYTILRHAVYAEALVNDLDDTLDSGVLIRPGGSAACAYIARDDLGLSAATVLAEDGHENRIYDETMDEALTGTQVARTISDIFGRPVRFEPAGPEAFAAYLVRRWNMPESLARSTIGTARAIEAGQFDIVSPDYQRITGRKPRGFRAFLEGVKAERER